MSSPITNLTGKVVLVAGATGALGSAIAQTAAWQGATVILLGRSTAKLTKVYDSLVTAECAEPALIEFDLATATPEQYAQLADTVSQNFGKLDALVHAAGYMKGLTPLAHLPHNQWHDALAINLSAPFFLTQALLPVLLTSPHARVLFLGDPVAEAYWNGYAVAKAGLAQLAHLFALEFENTPSIAFEYHMPGKVRSAMRLTTYQQPQPDWQDALTVARSVMRLLA